jgi:hypothetical protein
MESVVVVVRLEPILPGLGTFGGCGESDGDCLIPSFTFRWRQTMSTPRAVASLMIVYTLCQFGFSADEKKGAKSGEFPKELPGSWEQVIAQVGNQIQKPDPGGAGVVKQLHITATHFTRITYLPKTKQLLGVVGGRCSTSDGKYIETIDVADEASRQAVGALKPLEFTVDVKNDSLVLKRVGGDPDDSEVWKRVR